MELSGTLIQTLESQTGIGKNGPWKKFGFIVETNEKYPKKVCVFAWNEIADIAEKLNPGTALKVHFDVESREFNGKWYTDVKAWKIEITGENAPHQQPAATEGDFVVEKDSEHEPLPF